MNLGHDIEKKIIVLASGNEALHLVCKAWNKVEMNRKRHSVSIIENWYKSRPLAEDDISWGYMRLKLKLYDTNIFLRHTTFAILKLDSDVNFLNLLPLFLERNKSDVRRWIIENPANISNTDWSYVGI